MYFDLGVHGWVLGFKVIEMSDWVIPTTWYPPPSYEWSELICGLKWTATWIIGYGSMKAPS